MIKEAEMVKTLVGGGKRDHFLDCAKGICVFAIIFIHTVFWSGGSYVPNYIRNLSLLFDVPVFFFLTGCLINIKPNVDVCKQIFKIALLFLVPVLVINLPLGACTLKNILSPVFLQGVDIKYFPLIGGSYWFIRVYIIALLYTILISRFTNKICHMLILIAIFIYYIYSYCSGYILKIQIFGTSAQLELCYLWFMLLGALCYKLKNKCFWIAFILIGLISYIVFNYNIAGFSLQKFKFTAALPYFLCTFCSIGLIMTFKNFLKNNFLEYIGNKALYFYLSQGFGGSILIYLVKHIHIYWIPKLIICFGINVLISISLGLVFCRIPEFINLIIEKLKCLWSVRS